MRGAMIRAERARGRMIRAGRARQSAWCRLEGRPDGIVPSTARAAR
jgi:hypothetical protein